MHANSIVALIYLWTAVTCKAPKYSFLKYKGNYNFTTCSGLEVQRAIPMPRCYNSRHWPQDWTHPNHLKMCQYSTSLWRLANAPCMRITSYPSITLIFLPYLITSSVVEKKKKVLELMGIYYARSIFFYKMFAL